MRRPVATLMALIIATVGAAYLGAMFPPGVWYAELNKPSWTPPGAAIGPVWSLLYVLMMVAVWRVWRAPRTPASGVALTAYAVQIGLNGLWSYVFFGRHLLAATLVLVGVLWLAVLTTLVLFVRVDRWSGRLLAPYAFWVGFDVVWFLALVRLNG